VPVRFGCGPRARVTHSVAEMDYETNGHVIANSDKIREVHNSFARSDPFALDELQQDSSDKEDAFHFISYLPIGDSLYELDGLKPKPLSHGKIPPGADWLNMATDVLQARIATYAETEVHFSLMAIVGDRLQQISGELAQVEATATSMADEAARQDAYTRLAQLQSDLRDEQDKRQRHEFEIRLKRHNLTGFSVQLLIELAKRGQLQGRVSAAKETMKGRRAAQAAAGEQA
jgi:ubiquitin carboxyl-terminal hydrolase L5